jgi:hypothetical protein
VEGRDGQDEARAGNKRRLPSLSRTTRRVTAGHTRSAGFRFESSQAVSGSGEVVTGVATERKPRLSASGFRFGPIVSSGLASRRTDACSGSALRCEHER